MMEEFSRENFDKSLTRHSSNSSEFLILGNFCEAISCPFTAGSKH